MGKGGGGGVKAFAGGPVVGYAKMAKDYIVGGNKQNARDAANAAENAALAQRAEARRQRAEMRELTEGVTVEGLAQYDKALAVQDKNLSRQEQLVASIDPTILEASQQALRLLRGESASSLNPLQQQRAMQRQKLVDTLRAQLGPGAETSSAGQRALSRFDMETNSLMSGAQQAALSSLGNVAGQFNSIRPDMLGQAIGLGQLASNRAGLRYTQGSLISGTNQGLLNSAGAQFVGDALMARANQAQHSGLVGMVGTVGGAVLGGYAGGPQGAQAGASAGGAAGKGVAPGPESYGSGGQ